MRWFEGGIAEAVATSKAKNAVFVVFIEGKDEASKSTAATVDNVTISTKLESEDFVAIKLDSESEAYRQFTQIYHLVPVPSLFFIGGNGVPLEVVAGEIQEPELLRRIGTVLEKSGRKPEQEKKPSVSSASANEEKHSEPQGSSTNEVASSSVDDSVPEVVAEVVKTDEVPTESATTSADALSSEEKVERAKDLIEKKRKQKQQEEDQIQRMKELERRKVGQDVQKLRRWQQDQELKQLKEERQKEKAEEAAARERILKQIAEDRAERNKKFYEEKEAAKKVILEQQEAKRQESVERSTPNIARIQFRLPDGASHSNNFEPTTTLGEVRAYAASQLNLPVGGFTMSTSFPRREFTANDDSQNLRDLQLTPTAVILILPTSSGTGVTSSSPGYSWALSRMVWSFLTPFFSMLNYLRNALFGGGAGAGTVGGNTRKDTSPAGNQGPTGAKRRRPNASESSVQRQGNIHRLTNRDSSDDENNTWNGNSTQQM